MQILRSWFICADEVEDPQSRLICFPHGGAGASAFRKWRRFVPPEIQLCAVQLPGREYRIQEGLRTDLLGLAREIAGAVNTLPLKPFCIFGHSLGALLGFEVARRLRSIGSQSPSLLVVSGYPGPSLARTRPAVHALGDAEFLAAVKKYEGVPDGVLEHPELSRILLPVLRADFTLAECYRYFHQEPLNCPILALAGLNDASVSAEQMTEWRRESMVSFQMLTFRGNHFFPYQDPAPVVDAIADSLQASSPF